MFSAEVIEEISAGAAELGLEPAAFLAIAEVESGGSAYSIVGGRMEPLIRFEGHYFDRRLSAENCARARAEGLASPTAGTIANPKTQGARWQMLERAAAIDRKAAFESISWGIGQVMGAHWAWLGYRDVEALVAEARSGAIGQTRLMVRYIEKAGLSAAIRDHDWSAFARGYNGPDYRRNAYHLKIAAAYAKFSGAAGGLAQFKEPGHPILRAGIAGEAVADLQRMLSALGYPTGPDGIFGPATENAVRRFQAGHQLQVDGIVGEMTKAALETALSTPNPVNIWRTIWGWISSLRM